MELASAILTLLLIMDPVGNVPTFLAYLKDFDDRQRRRIVMRESGIALLILFFFLFCGQTLLRMLGIGEPALSIAGGVLLFLIALGLIFPSLQLAGPISDFERAEGPFIVPLATPLIAGPSAIATITIFTSRQPERLWQWALALAVAWAGSTAVLLLSSPLSRWLGRRGLTACERLMGMLLTVIAVQMFLDGIHEFVVRWTD